MKKGKIETPLSRNSDKSPRGSFSEKSPLLGLQKFSAASKNHFASIEEEELGHLPYKESELQTLAKQIGIDFDAEKDKYLWFLIQIVNLDLPPGWMKEEDPSGAIYYHNPNENLTSSKHPMISKFRSLFNEILENEIAGKAKMLALKEKVQKLEQDKDGLSPKRPRELPKLDKARKFKAAATVIAMTSSLASKVHKGENSPDRLRMIPEPPQHIIDSEKLKEKFNKVKEVLEKRRHAKEEKINEVDNLAKTEEILSLCKLFYIEQYGTNHKEAPPSIYQLESYDLVDPMEIVEAARLFNVKSTQAFLFWVLRAYCSLPLPEYWTKTFDTNLHREIYYNSCYDVKISVKPCYFYVLDLINYLKQEAIRDKDSLLHFSNKMTLCDKLGRQYDVDLASMVKDLIEKPNNERKNYFTYHQKKDTFKEETQKVTKKRKKDDFNPNYSDAHFIEIANQLGVDLSTEIHLLMVIEDFVRSREPVERWFFRQAAEGSAFWVNHEQQKAVNRYPYLKDLKKIIDEARKSYQDQLEDAKKHLKAEFNLIKVLFRKFPEDVARKILIEEARNFVEYFFKLKLEGQANNLNLDAKGYNLTNLVKKIGTTLSKHDLMDLLFYCPFDFTQYIAEDFLKSSESYLMKKIHLRTGEKGQKGSGSGDDFDGLRDKSFESEEANDAAKKIRLKIEDSKKLLDLAANIKELHLDPEKKREFMKLLIDFDQKYGDHDLVDALEQDITDNMKDEAAITQTLISKIKTTLQKDLNGKDIDDSLLGGSSSQREKTSSRAKNRPSTFSKDQISATSKKGAESADEHNNSFEARVKSEKDDNAPGSKQDASAVENQIKTSEEEEQDEEEGEETGSKKSTKGKKNKGKNSKNNDFIKVETYGGRKDKKNGTLLDNLEEDEDEEEEIDENLDGDDDGTRSRSKSKNKTTKSIAVTGLDLNGEENGNADKVPSKFIYDENGKIIFTSKKTQELLEGLAEEEQRSSKRKNTKDGRFGSIQGSIGGDDEDHNSIERGVSQSKNFEDHEIVYQEIITENGERKLVPINIKSLNSKSDLSKNGPKSGSVERTENRSKSPIDSKEKIDSQKMLHSSSSKKLLKNASTKSLAKAQNNKEVDSPEGLPMVIGSSFKPPNWQKGIFKSSDGQWDPAILTDSLQKLNGENQNSAQRKGDKKEVESRRLSNLADSSRFGDATGLSHSRSQLTPTGKPKVHDLKNHGISKLHQQQTYKSLEPGLQHLDMVRPRYGLETTDKLGIWTHVELFDMGEGYNNHNPVTQPRSPFEILRMPGTARLLEEYNKMGQNSSTFYTPYRRGNLGIKKFMEYMTYLNSIVFIKKLDALIANFLIKQFTSMQQENLGLKFKPEDPEFRTVFQSRYHKLIKQLRENLLKKKDFVNTIYTRIVNSPAGMSDIFIHGLANIQEVQQKNNSNKPSSNQAFMIGGSAATSPQGQQNLDFSIKPVNNSVSFPPLQSPQSVKLPQLTSHRKLYSHKYKTSTDGFKMDSTLNNESCFGDERIRTIEIFDEQQDIWQPKPNETSKTRKGNFFSPNQKSQEAEKVLKALAEHEQENYKHYWDSLGDPLKLNSSVIFTRVEKALGIQPAHVILMGHRLGIQIQNVEEADLAWIPYLALMMKLPANIETNMNITSPKSKTRYQKICNMKYGEHPGDNYFKTLLIYNQLKKRILVETMSLEEQTEYLKSQSWVKLREENGAVYYYNFSTKQRALNLPINQKEMLSKAKNITLRSEIKEKLRLASQVVIEHDNLLSLFKNKFKK